MDTLTKLDRETKKTEIVLFVTAAASLGASLYMFPEWPSLVMASLCGFNLAGGISQHFQRTSLCQIGRTDEIVEQQAVINLPQIESCNLAVQTTRP